MRRCWRARARGSRTCFPGRPSSSSCRCRACTKSITSSRAIMSHEGRPDFKSPALGCDTHFHVFGPDGRYPYNQADLRYAPPVAPLEDFLALAKKLGIERFVFVQPSAYGRDNRCMLEAMREVGTQNCRGIADIEENAPDAELERLHGAGVRGVRINVPPVKPHEAGFAATLLPRIDRLRGRCAAIGRQVGFLAPGWL